MPTVGKISGGLLKENLLREGVNLAFETDLIYLDVNNQWVGINTSGPFIPLTISGTFNSDNLISDTQITVDYLTFDNNEISTSYPNLVITAAPGGTVSASRLGVGGLDLSGNLIKTTRSNENLDLEPAGSGQVKFLSNTRVIGNLHATGDVTYDGDIIFGNNDLDSVTFSADVASDMLPNDAFKNIGSSLKGFSDLFTENVNGTNYIISGLATSVDFAQRQGNIYYVAINGDDTNVGDHPNGPYRHIKTALLAASSGDTVYIYPGDYEEVFPLTVPTGVTVYGMGIRAVNIFPTSGTNDKDAFLLNGETTVSNLTVKNFYYNSVNDTGYGFRFAPNFTVTSRSPYVQNISVITNNTGGTAGKGALVDGASALYTTNEASMLFHSVTFITPGVDALTMTNGVRVEWLNSFTYFANKGLSATQGTGRLTQDGITLRYGAELRSINSANVYGTYGAYADGANVLMYLINHNFGYIGTGTDSSNDPSLVIQENEIVTLNNADIHFTSLDQVGNFRVGDIFTVEGETGIVRFNSLAFSLNGLYLTDGPNITDITASKVQTGNILISGNTIESTVNNIILDASNNQIDFTSNVTVDGNVITEDLVTDANTTIGTSSSDSLNFNSRFSQNLFTTSNKDLGSSTKLWNNLYTTELNVNDVRIVGNQIKTVVSNSNLELNGNGTGIVRIDQLDVDSNKIITNTLNTDLEINPNGTGTIELLKDTYITGNLGVSGNITVGGNVQLGDVILDNINTVGKIGSNLIPNVSEIYDIGTPLKNWRSLYLTELALNDILVETNFISTTLSNSNLEFSGNGTGSVRIDQIDIINNSISINSTDTDVNFQSTGVGVVDLASSTDIGNNLIVSNNLTVNTNTQLGDSSSDSVNLVGELISSVIPKLDSQYTLGSPLKEFNNVYIDTLTVNDVNITGNVISTTVSNSDLELSATDEVTVPLDNVDITNNLTVLATSNLVATSLVGALNQTGNTSRTGNINLTGDLTTSSLSTSDLVQLNDIKINTNVITTTNSNSDLELRANGVGQVRFFDNTTIEQNLAISGNTTVTNLTIFSSIESPVLTTTNINILGNLITTTVPNTNLDLGANGTGVVRVTSDSVNLGVDLTVSGTTNLKATTVTGTIDITGNYNQTSASAIFSTNTAIGSGDVSTASVSQFEDIRVSGNRISTTVPNNNLIITANGTGIIDIQDSANFANNLTVSGSSSVAGSITVSNILTAGGYDFGNIVIAGNVIRTTESNSNLELRGNASGGIKLEDITLVNTTFTSTSSITLVPTGSGSVRFNANNALTVPKGTTANRTLSEAGELRFNTTANSFEGYGNAGLIILDKFEDGDRNTRITPELTVGSGDNVIRFFTNGTQRVSLDSSTLTAHGLRTSTLDFNSNTISSYNSNADIELKPNGTGKVVYQNFSVKDGVITNTSTNAVTVIANTGQGHTVLGDKDLVMPIGDNTNRPASPEIGHTRWNTTLGYLEVWTGTQWLVATGGGSYISEAEVNDITDFYALIFG